MCGRVASGRRSGRAARLAWFPRVIVDPEVAEALRARRGVVALESTLIAHGLPAPDNLRVAREAEAAVRAAGGHGRDAKLRLELRDGHRPGHTEALDDGRAARVSQQAARS